MRLILSTCVLLLLSNVLAAQKKDTVPCPDEGKANSPQTRRSNILKNREIVHGKLNSKTTLDSLLIGGKEDTGMFSPNDFVSITGYVLGAEDVGPESCNCFSKDSDKTNIKIYVGNSVNSWKDSVIVVEVTAKYRQMYPSDYIDDMIGQKVKFDGYLMYNFDAKKFALKACKTCRTTDRKTAWEICPVTDIKVLTHPTPPPPKKQ